MFQPKFQEKTPLTFEEFLKRIKSADAAMTEKVRIGMLKQLYYAILETK